MLSVHSSRRTTTYVEDMIEPELFRWLESLGLSDIPPECKTNPPRFVYWLVFTLLGNGEPAPVISETSKSSPGLDYLRAVRPFLKEHEMDGRALEPSLRSITYLYDRSDNDKYTEGLTILNAVVKLLRDYVTPTDAFESQVSRTLTGSEESCEGIVREIEIVSQENRFYRKKIEKIEAILRENSKDPQARVVTAVLQRMYGSKASAA
jgi:hypothetical protein